ncbi:hypothetical protein ACFQ67_11495 [Streptomyces sp. NPDC056488]|uniref:hypothetical protein n=1 Tax=Streptomyces sp. NPDC056488 TaxID=3345836 RepID=UPI003687BF6D
MSDQEDERQVRDDWHRPMDGRVPTGLTDRDGRPEFVEGDPVALQDWDARRWGQR